MKTETIEKIVEVHVLRCKMNVEFRWEMFEFPINILFLVAKSELSFYFVKISVTVMETFVRLPGLFYMRNIWDTFPFALNQTDV